MRAAWSLANAEIDSLPFVMIGRAGGINQRQGYERLAVTLVSTPRPRSVPAGYRPGDGAPQATGRGDLSTPVENRT